MARAVIVIGLLAAAGRASGAEEVSARLLYVREPGAEVCPDEGAIRGAIAVRLGYDPFREPASRRVSVDIQATAAGLEAKLVLSDQEGVLLGARDLSSGAIDCRELAEAVTLSASIALDPVGFARPEAPPPSPPLAAPPPPAPILSPAVVLPLGPQLLPSLGVLGAAGAAVEPNGGFELGAELRWPHLSLWLGGRVDLPAGAAYRGGSFGTELVVGELAPCFRLGSFALCALLAAGAEVAQAQRLPGAQQTAGPFVAAGGRATGELPVAGRLSLRLALDLLVPLTQCNVHAGDDLVFTTPAVSGAASLSAVVRFL